MALNNTVKEDDPEVIKWRKKINVLCRGSVCANALRYLLSFVYMDDNYKTQTFCDILDLTY
jgi:hypothetical protein